MDHLPPVSRPYNPVQVPYLGGRYDGEDFEGYPMRQHLDLQRLQKGDPQGRSNAEVARFIQTWLYFGMLHGVLGVDASTQDFVRVEVSDQHYVTTQKLKEYLQRWRSLMDQERGDSSNDSLIPRNQQALQCLKYSHAFWFGLDETQRNELVGAEIGLSIHILASTLEHALTSIYDIPVSSVPWRLTRNDFLAQRMQNYGWCPVVVDQIGVRQHLAFQYYASLLKAPSNPNEHAQCRVGDSGCKAKNILNDVYTTRHVEIGCTCEDVAIEISTLRDLVQEGNVPLVSLEYEGPKPVLKLVGFEQGMQYTALSHVWSDGLGNPLNNALPTCQLQRIHKMVSELPQFDQYSNADIPIDDRVWRDFVPYKLTQSKDKEFASRPQYFWIDTLCVPLLPEQCRKNAIKNMRAVYSRATKVLVLDTEMIRSTMDSSSEEKLSRITCSTWIRRLWTLQEAALARVAYYQFAEEAAVILDPEPTPNADSPYEPWYDNEVAYYAHLFQFNWWKMTPHTTQLDRIYFVFQALKDRSTSHIEDEPICLATLLDLPLGELLEAPKQHRLKKLWTLCHQLPAAILFLPGTKLTDEAFGWAPASCMDVTNIGIPKNIPATVTAEGLVATLNGFLLSGPPPPPTKGLIACKLQAQLVYIRQNLKLGNPSWEGLKLDKCSNLAVILNASPPFPLQGCVGALLNINETRGGVIFARYIRMVSVIGKDSRFDRIPNPPWSDVEVQEKSRGPVDASYVKAEQTWCIG